jgi:hypothetical protein
MQWSTLNRYSYTREHQSIGVRRRKIVFVVRYCFFRLPVLQPLTNVRIVIQDPIPHLPTTNYDEENRPPRKSHHTRPSNILDVFSGLLVEKVQTQCIGTATDLGRVPRASHTTSRNRGSVILNGRAAEALRTEFHASICKAPGGASSLALLNCVSADVHGGVQGPRIARVRVTAKVLPDRSDGVQAQRVRTATGLGRITGARRAA